MHRRCGDPRGGPCGQRMQARARQESAPGEASCQLDRVVGVLHRHAVGGQLQPLKKGRGERRYAADRDRALATMARGATDGDRGTAASGRPGASTPRRRVMTSRQPPSSFRSSRVSVPRPASSSQATRRSCGGARTSRARARRRATYWGDRHDVRPCAPASEGPSLDRGAYRVAKARRKTDQGCASVRSRDASSGPLSAALRCVSGASDRTLAAVKPADGAVGRPPHVG
jgi:hypothetical protein